MQDDSSLGPGRYLLALFALCLLALLVFASRSSAQDSTTGASQQAADPRGQTTAETTSPICSPSATASPEVTSSADELTADVPRDADEFRCEFFLHEVRGVRGNVRSQYLIRAPLRAVSLQGRNPRHHRQEEAPCHRRSTSARAGFPAVALVGAGILVARRR